MLLVGDSGVGPLHAVYKTATLPLHQSPTITFSLYIYYTTNFVLCQIKTQADAWEMGSLMTCPGLQSRRKEQTLAN